MKYNSKKVLTIIATICLITVISGNSFAHSGRTDSSGGHKDNQNKSGLGSYHYHCGGYPAHLHDNGVCPFSSSFPSSSNASNNRSDTSKSSSESIPTSSSVESIPTSTTTLTKIIEATSVEINENISSMKVGESRNLTVTISPENTEDTSVVWSTNDEDIATVSSTGKVVALKEGTVNITATTSNEKTDAIAITVEKVEEENNTIIVPKKSNELNAISNNTEETDTGDGILGLGLLGGGSYFGYKKYKNKKMKK